MKLFCETRPIQVMGLGEIGHVIVWRFLPLAAAYIAALSNSRIYFCNWVVVFMVSIH
jgi:hypothetical protein